MISRVFYLKKRELSTYIHVVCFKEGFNKINRNESISTLWGTKSQSVEPSGTSSPFQFLSQAPWCLGAALSEHLLPSSLSRDQLSPIPHTHGKWCLATFDFIILNSKQIPQIKMTLSVTAWMPRREDMMPSSVGDQESKGQRKGSIRNWADPPKEVYHSYPNTWKIQFQQQVL